MCRLPAPSPTRPSTSCLIPVSLPLHRSPSSTLSTAIWRPSPPPSQPRTRRWPRRSSDTGSSPGRGARRQPPPRKKRLCQPPHSPLLTARLKHNPTPDPEAVKRQRELGRQGHTQAAGRKKNKVNRRKKSVAKNKTSPPALPRPRPPSFLPDSNTTRNQPPPDPHTGCDFPPTQAGERGAEGAVGAAARGPVARAHAAAGGGAQSHSHTCHFTLVISHLPIHACPRLPVRTCPTTRSEVRCPASRSSVAAPLYMQSCPCAHAHPRTPPGELRTPRGELRSPTSNTHSSPRHMRTTTRAHPQEPTHTCHPNLPFNTLPVQSCACCHSYLPFISTH